MGRTPATLRRTPLALAVSLALVAGTLAIGMNVAGAASSVRKFSATLVQPACVKVGSTGNVFTATFTNDGTSNQPLGSAKIDSEDNATAFKEIANIAITSAPAGKTWTAAPDHVNPDGVILKATSSASALGPNQSVSVTFTATAPSVAVVKTWKTSAWQSTSYTTSFTRTSQYPTTQVSITCVGPAAGIAFVTGPTSTTSGGTMAPPVTVKVSDSGGNGVSGRSVTLTSAGLSGGSAGPVTTGSDGVATFSGLTVVAAAGSYNMTASDGTFTTSPASFSVTAGAPASITFTKQPTDTLVNTKINNPNPGGVEVLVKDASDNPVPGVTVTMAISPDSFATGVTLGGASAPATDGSGKTTFADLTIDTTSSGYKLLATSGAASGTSGPGLTTFAITSTDTSCGIGDNPPCEATLPNGGTVTADPGTTLIVEQNNVVNCDGFTGFAGTVTIIPSGSGNTEVVFDDPYGNPGTMTEPYPQPGVTYPFCKGTTANPTNGHLLHWPVDQCATGPNPPTPCIESQAFITGPLNLVTKILIDSNDPPVRH